METAVLEDQIEFCALLPEVVEVNRYGGFASFLSQGAIFSSINDKVKQVSHSAPW